MILLSKDKLEQTGKGKEKTPKPKRKRKSAGATRKSPPTTTKIDIKRQSGIVVDLIYKQGSDKLSYAIVATQNNKNLACLVPAYEDQWKKLPKLHSTIEFDVAFSEKGNNPYCVDIKVVSTHTKVWDKCVEILKSPKAASFSLNYVLSILYMNLSGKIIPGDSVEQIAENLILDFVGNDDVMYNNGYIWKAPKKR